MLIRVKEMLEAYLQYQVHRIINVENRWYRRENKPNSSLENDYTFNALLTWGLEYGGYRVPLLLTCRHRRGFIVY